MEFFDNNAIVLPYLADAGAEISCVLTWDSEVVSTLRGNEGRGGFRALPRPKMAFTARTSSIAQSADLRSRLLAAFDLDHSQSGGRGRVAAPWQARACWLAQDAPAGAMNLPLDPTPWPWRNADGWIAFSDPQSAAAGKGWTFGVATGIDGGFNLALSAPLAQALPAGSAVYPLFVGRIEVGDRASMINDARLRQPWTIWGERQFIDVNLPAACQSGVLTNFDYAIIRFQWQAENGTDLDTRTALISPHVETDVGWGASRQSQVPAAADVPFLLWGGDNTTPTGAEAVLINFAAIAAAYPGANTITIRLRANWYSTRQNGQFNLQFATYAGGTMQGPTNFDFVNIGGVAVDNINRTRTIASNVNADVDGDECGTLVYTPSTRSAVIIDP